MDKFLKERIDLVAIWARNNGYPDVCTWMLAREAKQRKAEHKPRTVKAQIAAPHGRKPRKSDGFEIDPALLAQGEVIEQ